MEILSLEASTTSAKAMLYHTGRGSFDVRTHEYAAGNYKNDTTIKRAESVFQQMMAAGRELADGQKLT